MLKAESIATVKVEGFHHWPEAEGRANFLANRHRHMFTIRAGVIVSQDRASSGDREVEFILLGRGIKRRLEQMYGVPCEFGSMSCEQIAEKVLKAHGLGWCEVWEDEENGARVSV